MAEEKVNYGKPEGKEGEQLLDNMDYHHTPVSLWSIDHMKLQETDTVLDIGCGSGLNVKRLHQKTPKSKTYGVDYSSTSVKKSKLLNKELIESQDVEIIQANVLDMPFEEEYFDVITAFETVYFWPDIVDSFKQVKRILKNDGKFCIVLDANGIYAPEIEEVAIKEGCTFYTDEELVKLLKDAGYTDITVYNRKRLENKKVIKQITRNSYSEETVDEYLESKIEEDEPVTPEWLCIISKK